MTDSEWSKEKINKYRAIIERIADSGIRESIQAKIFPEKRVLHIDLETASELDLRKVGASAYSRHHSTIVTTVAWAFDDGKVVSIPLPARWSNSAYGYLPKEVYDHLMNGGVFHAWNAAFEWAFLTNWFGFQLKPEQASCTMQRSLYAGLPGKLEQAGPALNLSLVKDASARTLMLQMAKPRKDGTFWHDDPVEGPAKLDALEAYCRQDVVAEREVGKNIPALIPYEEVVSRMDRLANNRGIRLDLPLIHRLMDVAKVETWALDAECQFLTGGKVTSPGTQTQRLLGWLWDQGVKIHDVSKEIVQETFDTAAEAEIPELPLKVLAIRQKVAKSSVKKLQAMLNTVDDDGRVRGTLQYYGAGRTGRFSGRLIQPQNFPRPPKGWKPNDAIDAIMGGLDNDGIRTFYGEPLSVVSACLRGCLIPSQGQVFLVFDLSQIEARTIAWLAGQDDVLEVFRRGEDVYLYTATLLGLGSRDAGKVAVLGLGFGMGHEAFVAFAASMGLMISKMESHTIVTDWRQANSHIQKFWWGLGDAAIAAIQNPNHTYIVGRLAMVTGLSHGRLALKITLPSGRPLYYRNPRLVPDPTTGRHAIIYDGIDQYTKQWASVRTWGSKLAENVTQAVARDVIVESAQRVSYVVPGAKLVLSVHDEVLFEVDPPHEPDLFVAAAKGIVEARPEWALDLPIACEGGILQERYGKP